MIEVGVTQQLAGQLRERGAEVVELPHPGGHQIYPAALPEIRRIVADVTMPTTRSAE
jgi:predicted esterase